MNYQIDKNSKESAYLQLYRYLRQDITVGVYPYGKRLPSKRVISGETGLSLITVEHSLELLLEEGYVESRARSGYYVVFRDRDFTIPASEPPITDYDEPEEKATATGEEGVKFPFSVLARTMRKVLMDHGDSILIKSPNPGCMELRYEICAYLKRSRGISVEPSQIVIGAGAEYLYGLIAQLLGTDGVYALENPSYDKIRKVYHSLDIECDMLNMGPDGIRSSELKRTGARVLHVTPFNSFPSGITAGISKKHEYLLWAKERNGYIIEDNYDSELTVSKKPEEPLFTMSGGTNVIYLNTFSQTIAPSIRMGYMIVPEDMLDRFNERIGFYSCTVSLFEQYVLADLIRSGDFERHINRVRRLRRKEVKNNEGNL